MQPLITTEGMQRLQRKILDLNAERPVILEQIETARAMGDLSENAEYHAAKERQRNLDRELSYLSSRVSVLKTIDPATLQKDVIRFGAFIKLCEVLEKKKCKCIQYQLVGPDEVYDRDDNIILVSYESPLGKSMLGKKINDEFVVLAPKGELRYKILEIK
jgi:transcription elongation factor GreA